MLENIRDGLTENIPLSEKEKVIQQVENLKDKYVTTKQSSEVKKNNIQEACTVSNEFEELYNKVKTKCEEIEKSEVLHQELSQVNIDESDICIEKCKGLESTIDNNEELLKDLETNIEKISGMDLENMSNEMKDKLTDIKDRLVKAEKDTITKESSLKNRVHKHEEWNSTYENAITILDTTMADYDIEKSIGSSLDEIENNIKNHKLSSQKIADSYNSKIKKLEARLDELYPECSEVDIDVLNEKFAKVKDKNKEFVTKCRSRERQLKNGLIIAERLEENKTEIIDVCQEIENSDIFQTDTKELPLANCMENIKSFRVIRTNAIRII